ncbi:MAG: ATP-dependent RecD-like DNA helicase [Holosporaceae bacterium]|jgi:exodeoxyribonuclease V alpha subunit|nr:ATP-dependent RecD-like DNA helicase [Holosporaceae bacterium]
MQSEVKTLTELRGQLERVTYANEENGYVIAKVRVRGYRDPITVTGNIPSPVPGEVLCMSGEWHNHPKFGEQFKVASCSCSVPASVYGIEKYLGSGLIRGVGPIMAKRIVNAFGEKTLEVIEKSVEKLLRVEGIGRGRIGMIAKSWAEQKEIRSVMIFLQSCGITSAYAAKIYKRYGNRSVATVKENPYRLTYDVAGIGFLTADEIARKLGFDEKSPVRAESGIMFALHETAAEGHIYYPFEALLSKCKELLNADESVLKIAFQSLLAENKIVIEDLHGNDRIIRGVFQTDFHAAEVQVAKMLKRIRDSAKNVKEIQIDKELKDLQKKLSITLAEKQIEAIKTVVANKLTVITGGPGTGKTTVTKAILEIFSSVTDKILLTAPTGRAAKRMSETSGRSAKTVHRVLEFDPVTGKFKRNDENRLVCDLLILDEASMTDMMLMYHLLKAVPEHATLVLIGDINQLPSVGAGSVLRDIINSRVFRVAELNEIFRQARQSSIIINAHEIINGRYPKIDNKDGSDFYFVNEKDPEKISDKILLMVKERIPGKFGVDPVKDVQVLTPVNRGTVGVAKLNEVLQEALNPNGFEIVRGGCRYRVGDKVMQIRNNYDKNVFNGDIGVISRADRENQIVCVNIDGNELKYEYSEIDELVLAYAVSIHKSQGSEYPVVVIPLVTAHYTMLQRNLVYTGITRGKKLVVIIGSREAMLFALKNDKIAARNTWLEERLRN